MHTIDINNYTYRTDLIIEQIDYKNLGEHFENGNVLVDKIVIDDNNFKSINKKKGSYVTISFNDITDKDNFKKVEEVLIKQLKSFFDKYSVYNKKVLVVGLGNSLSTPDSLGPLCIDNILVTSHLFKFGEVENGYVDVSAFKPQVMGATGIETSDIIYSLVNTVGADVLVVIDALASSSIERVNKTIQITDTGIHPGSGVGNDRKEISFETLNIPVLAVGVPTIVDAATIVTDTLKYMIKHFSYRLDNYHNIKDKLIFESDKEYEKAQDNLSYDMKNKILGIVGTLNDRDLKKLVYEVLFPLDYNLMVTPKEIDYMVEKLSLLISSGINKALHKNFNTTK